MKVTDKSETAIIRKDARQGCLLSLTYLICMESSQIKEIGETLIRNKVGIKMGRELISSLRFADDIALLTNNEHDLERTLKEMTSCFQKYNLIINWQKLKL